jgi:hypothetical protein
LRGLIERLDNKDYPKNDAWVNRASSVVRKYFGPKSEQYHYISHFDFLPGRYALQHNMHGIPTQWEQMHKNKMKVKIWLEECIADIELNGLHKSDELNFLYRIKPEWLIAWMTMATGGLIGLGVAISNYQNVELQKTTIERQKATINRLSNTSTKSDQ